MYEQRMRRNLRAVIEEHGFVIHSHKRTLKSISARYIWNVERGLQKMSISKLEEVADEIGADFLDFFRE